MRVSSSSASYVVKIALTSNHTTVSSDQNVHAVIVLLRFLVDFRLHRFRTGITPNIVTRFATDVMCGITRRLGVTCTIDHVLVNITIRAGLSSVTISQLRCRRRLGVVVAQSVFIERNLRVGKPRQRHAVVIVETDRPAVQHASWFEPQSGRDSWLNGDLQGTSAERNKSYVKRPGTHLKRPDIAAESILAHINKFLRSYTDMIDRRVWVNDL